MISKRFLVWKDSANVRKRAAAASALGRAYLQCDFAFEELCGAEAAMTVLADDPSPKVRLALAEAIASSMKAPAQVIAALARDQHSIASIVIARSPVLSDHDLEVIVPVADDKLQRVIARRPEISNRLARRLAKHGGPQATLALVDNPNADMCAQCLEMIVANHGGQADIRGRLLERADLGVQLRFLLVRQAAQAIASTAFSSLFADKAHLEKLARDSFEKSFVHMLDYARAEDYPALIHLMRESNDLTTTQLIRAACFGKMDFLAHVLADLSGKPYEHVTSIFVQERRAPVDALMADAGVAPVVRPILSDAITLWKRVAQGVLDAGAQEITYQLSQDLAKRTGERRDAANDDILALLRSIYLDSVQQNARHHALALAQAA